MSLALVIGLALLATSLGRAAPVSAQASTVSFTTAEVAPADSFAYVVTTTDDASEQWRLADVLLDRAGIGQALDEWLAEELRDDAGEDLPLDAFLGGEIGVVVLQSALDTLAAESMGAADLDAMLGSMGMSTPEAASDELAAQGFAIVLDARAPDTAWAAIRDSASEDPVEETTYEGTTIFYAPPASADEEGGAAARVGDLILFATTPMDLYPLIDTADGRLPAITTLPEFTTVRDALPGEFLMFAFANSAAVMDTDFGPFAAAASELSTESFTGLTISADEPGFRMETVALPVEGETQPQGAANYESELLTKAPADTVLFLSAADLGGTGVLDVVGATVIGLFLGMGDPSAMPDPNVSSEDFVAQQYEAAQSMIGINLQTDLFQQLDGEYGGWLAADLEAEVVSGLFASGLADAGTVANALMQLSFLIQGASGAEDPLTTRDVGGGTVYSIELGDEAGSTLEFGVVEDNLVIGKGDAVDRFGGPLTDSLGDDTTFQAVMDTLPVEYNGLTYVNLEQAIPLVEVASEQAGDMGLGGFDEVPDASESCAAYASQEEAQAAYDSAAENTFDLDRDFDGQVCEDFFVDAAESADAGSAGPDAGQAADALADVDYSGIKAFAVAGYVEDGLRRSSGILYISE